mgnify:CR=1 FL=1
MTVAHAQSFFDLNAGNNIEVNTDTGSLAMLDSTDKLAGALSLNAANVWIADQSILTKLEADPNYTARDADLGERARLAVREQGGDEVVLDGDVLVEQLAQHLLIYVTTQAHHREFKKPGHRWGQAVNHAAKSLRNIRSVYVKEHSATVENNKITQYRVDVKISFELDENNS